MVACKIPYRMTKNVFLFSGCKGSKNVKERKLKTVNFYLKK